MARLPLATDLKVLLCNSLRSKAYCRRCVGDVAEGISDPRQKQ